MSSEERGASQPSTAEVHTPLSSSVVPLVDRFGRVHRALRVSVTDVCNIRCQYCMPAEGATFLPRESLLSYPQIASFVRIAASCGLRKIRITGGEPLTRPGLEELIADLTDLGTLNDLALTTNGMLLDNQVQSLVQAGLRRINISLDTLHDETFRRLSRRDGLHRVLAGIESALAQPELELRLNALVLRDVNLGEVIELVRFARERAVTLRFIEFMPLDASRQWTQQRMVSGEELRGLIAAALGPLVRVAGTDASQPSVDYCFEDGSGRVGFIDTVSRPFCGSCDRLRLTAEGRLRNCLFGSEEWDVAEALRKPQVDRAAIVQRLQDCVAAKHPSHGIAKDNFVPPQRAMYQIGG